MLDHIIIHLAQQPRRAEKIILGNSQAEGKGDSCPLVERHIWQLIIGDGPPISLVFNNAAIIS